MPQRAVGDMHHVSATSRSNHTYSVIGIGQCSWDYLAPVDAYPPADSKQETGVWIEEGGGPVATALVTLARLGVLGRFHGVVGDDGAGEKIRRSLVAAGLDVSGVRVRPGAVSQTAFIAVEQEGGRRTIFWQRASGIELRPEEFSPDSISGADFLLLDGLMAEASLWGALQAHSRGIPVMLDAGRLRPGMLEIARECDYVVAAEQFAVDLGWQGDAEHFRGIAESLGAGTVTVTLGTRGSVTYREGAILPLPAFAVDAVDTTGAGDVFHGAYLYGLLRGWELPQVIAFASAAAAMKCRRIGGRAGIPNLGEILAFLDSRGCRFVSV